MYKIIKVFIITLKVSKKLNKKLLKFLKKTIQLRNFKRFLELYQIRICYNYNIKKYFLKQGFKNIFLKAPL